jgi:hypothetical protein
VKKIKFAVSDKACTLVPEVRQNFLLQQVLQVASLEGEVAEVGVWRGGSAKLLARAMPGRMVHLFDTFEGMPETSEFDILQPGDFSDTSLESVNEFLQGYNVHFWPGLFPDSARLLPRLLPDTQFVLVHVDVDIYESTKAACEFFWPLLVEGGIMVFDDYNNSECPGANKAVDEFFDAWQEIEVSGPDKQCGTRVVKTKAVRDDRPLKREIYYARIEALVKSEPEKQVPLGMQRECEHALVLRVAAEAKLSTYIEVGFGNGKLIQEIKRANPNTRVIGFDVPLPEMACNSMRTLDNMAAKGIELHVGDIFAEGVWDKAGLKSSFRTMIRECIESSEGPLMVYTDNGNKPAELEAVTAHMRIGDICGSHDFLGAPGCCDVIGSTEPSNISFLGQRNFAVMEQYEKYILDHLCLQRFWVKGTEFSGDPTRRVM